MSAMLDFLLDGPCPFPVRHDEADLIEAAPDA
jgi:hypothetical protein